MSCCYLCGGWRTVAAKGGPMPCPICLKGAQVPLVVSPREIELAGSVDEQQVEGERR